MRHPRRYTSPWSKAVASMLRDARTRSGWTQRELASVLDVEIKTIRRSENGHSEPSGAFIERWLELCGWDAEILAGPDTAFMRVAS